MSFMKDQHLLYPGRETRLAHTHGDVDVRPLNLLPL